MNGQTPALLLEAYAANERTAREIVDALVAHSSNALHHAQSSTNYSFNEAKQIELRTMLNNARSERERIETAYREAFAVARLRAEYVDANGTPLGAFDERIVAASSFPNVKFELAVRPAEEALLNQSVIRTLRELSDRSIHTSVMHLTPSAAAKRSVTLQVTELVTVVAGRGTLLLDYDSEEVLLEPGVAFRVPPDVTRRWLVERGLYGDGTLRLIVQHAPPLITANPEMPETFAAYLRN